MIIPFNIKHRPQIESGEYKVRTASGKPARIVCWDFKTQLGDPILALIQEPKGEGYYEYACTYREDGLYVGNNENYLVLEDGRTPELRWEDRVRQILRSYAAMPKVAEKLLDAAREEIATRTGEKVALEEALARGAIVEGTNGETRDDAPKVTVRPFSCTDKEYYDR